MITAIIVFFVALYIMNRVFLGVQPGKARMDSDLQSLRKKAAPYKDILVPWSNEELELVSFNSKDVNKSRGFGKVVSGVMNSIYHEGMFYFIDKQYMAADQRRLIYIQTKADEIVYVQKGSRTAIYLNEELLGYLLKDLTFVDQRGRQLYGAIERESAFRTNIIGADGLLGSVVIPESKDEINPRAFDMEKQLEGHDLTLFKILGIYEILHQYHKLYM